jgi:peroxin-6
MLISSCYPTEPAMTAVLNDCIQSLADSWKESKWPVIVVGTTGDVDKVPAGIIGCFKEDFVISVRGLLPTLPSEVLN